MAKQMEQSKINKILRLRTQKKSQYVIAKEVGCAQSQVSTILKEYGHQIQFPVPKDVDLKADKKQGRLNWREWTPTLVEMQRLKRESSFSQDHAVVELGDGTRPVAIFPYSDQHLGAWSTDYQMHREFTDQFLKLDDAYLALVGDYGQYSIKLRSVLEVSDNLLPPEQQTDFIESWFEEIWHRVACATWDNHGVERQEKQAGESSIKRMMSRKVVWFNGIGHMDFKVGNQVYKGAISHRFRGNSIENPCHAQMRYMRREGVDREFAIQGDTHRPGMIKYNDGPAVRCAINCGSIQTNSGYAKRYFSLFTCPEYPILVLYPDKHMMTPFWNVGEWLAARKAGTA